MGLLGTCPSCGFVSNDIRCPRCNALKVVGCDGGCSSCKSGSCKVSPGARSATPSSDAREDCEHPGTPLER